MLQSQFVRHVATLMSGKVASQAISLIAVPVIARLFNPDDFGVMAVFLSLVVILSNVAPLRYFRAGLIEKDENDANGLFIISIVSLLSISLLICVLTLICRYYDTDYPYKNTLGEWVWLLPAGVLLTGFTEILATANIRKKLFKTVATADIANTLVMAISRIAAGQTGSSV